jgi:hypothetical protein
MTIPQRINEFITKHRPNAFCDDCIAEKLDLSRRQQAHRVTSALGPTGDFRREVDSCSLCGNEKKVTRRHA